MKKTVSNILAILGGDAGGRAIGFLVTLYLARVLAPASFGIMNIGLAVLGYLSLAGSPGIQIVETRNAAAESGGMREKAGAILSMRLVLAGVLIPLTYAGVTLAGVPDMTRDVVVLYSLSLIPMALSLDWLFQGKEDFRGVMFSRVLNAVVFALVIVLLVHSESQVRFAPMAFLAGNVAGALMLGAMYRRRFGMPALAWDPAAWGTLLRANVPAGAAVLLAQSVSNLPPIVIGVLLSNAQAGIYSAGMKLIYVLLLVDRTLNALFLPMATRYAVSRREEYPALLSAALTVIVVVMVPLLIVACIVAGPAVLLVFGPGYEGAVPVVRVLTGFVLVTLLNSLMVCTLVAFGRTRTYSLIVGGGGLIVCVTVVIFTVLFGSPGAGGGIIAGEGIMLALLVRAASGVAPLPSIRFLLKPAIAGAAMAVAAVALSGFDPLICLLASGSLFVIVLFVINGVPRREFHYLRERLI